MHRKGHGTMSDDDLRDVTRSIRKIPPVAIIAAVTLVILIFLHPWVQVGAGQRGVVLNFGAVQTSVLDEGLHFLVPVMQKVAL
ncbi:MAG: hypothetical protein JW699_01150, partial [Chitinispirillaceae bacterium]|nr:hypothetical protein [Chitinispirillaceae bacterium]